jgi:hypothetical protein
VLVHIEDDARAAPHASAASAGGQATPVRASRPLPLRPVHRLCRQSSVAARPRVRGKPDSSSLTQV